MIKRIIKLIAFGSRDFLYGVDANVKSVNFDNAVSVGNSVIVACSVANLCYTERCAVMGLSALFIEIKSSRLL